MPSEFLRLVGGVACVLIACAIFSVVVPAYLIALYLRDSAARLAEPWRWAYLSVYLGPNYCVRTGWVLSIALGRRDNPPCGEYPFRHLFELELGRRYESLLDFGGVCWLPMWVYFYNFSPGAVWQADSRRWTGRRWQFIRLDWPMRARLLNFGT